MKYAFLTILGLGAAITASAQPPFLNLTSIDPHALNAVQLAVQVQFGPGTKPGSFQCPLQKSSPTGVCLASWNFFVPSGKRLVIENINASMSFNPNGSGLILDSAMHMGVTVGASTAFSSFPFESVLTVGGVTQYGMNKNVRFYVDSGPGFPEIFFANANGNALIPGDLGAATGVLNIVFQGYYVDTQ